MVCGGFVAFRQFRRFATNSTVLSEFGIFRRVIHFGIGAVWYNLYRIKELIYCWLQEIERERAKARQDVGRPKTGEVPANFPEDKKGDSRDIAAKKLGMSGKITTIDAVQAAREMPLAMPGGNNNPDGRNQHLKDTDDPKTVPVELGQVDNVNLTKNQKGGNRKEYLLKRLSRDFPQALDRIQSGELTTRKAAIEC